jgi:hypothetical protein
MHDLVRQQLKNTKASGHEETGCVGVHKTEMRQTRHDVLFFVFSVYIPPSFLYEKSDFDSMHDSASL